jgi:hypothetical protein
MHHFALIHKYAQKPFGSSQLQRLENRATRLREVA